MTYKEITSRVAAETGVSAAFVDRVYKAYWQAVRDHIGSLPLKDDLTDEEFLKLRPNVNIPSIGKLYVTLGRYRGMKKTHEYLRQLKTDKDAAHKQSEADVH